MKTLSTLLLLSWGLICTAQEIKIVPKNRPEGSLMGLALSPSGTFVATTYSGRQISVFETYTGREISRMPAGETRPENFQFLHDDTLMVVYGSGVEIIHLPSKKRVYQWSSGSLIVKSVIQPGSRTLALSTFDELISFRITDASLVQMGALPSPPVYELSLSENGGVLAGRKEEQLFCWQTSDFRLLGTLNASNIKSFEAASDYLVSFRKDATAYQFHHFNGETRAGGRSLDIPDPYLPRLQWTGDGFFLWYYKKIIHVDLDGNLLILDTDEFFRNMAFDTAANRFLTLSSDHIAITDMEGAELARISAEQLAPSDMYFHSEKEKNILLMENQVLFSTGNDKVASHPLGGSYVPPAVLEGDQLFIPLSDGTIEVWNVASEKKLKSIRHHNIPYLLKPAPGEEVVYVSDFQESALYAYDLHTGKGERIHQDPAPITAIETEGRILYFGNTEGLVSRAEKTEGGLRVRNRASLLGDGISTLRRVNDQLLVASFGRIGLLKKDLSDSSAMAVFVGHNGLIRHLEITPDQQFFLSTASDRHIRLWDLRKKKMVQSYDLDSVSAGRVQLINKNDFLFYGNGFLMGAVTDSISLRRHLSPATEIVVQSPNNNSPLKMAIDREGLLLASVDRNTVKVRDLRSGFLLSEFSTKTKIVNGICFTTDGSMLAVASGAAIECFDPLTGKPIREIALDKRNRSLHDVEAYSNVIVGINSLGWHFPLIVHKNSGLKVAEFWPTRDDKKDQWIRDFKCTPDGSLLITYGSDYVKVFENTGPLKNILTLPLSREGRQHRGFIDYMNLSPDGKHLLYTDVAKTMSVHIVEILSGKKIREHSGGLGAIGREGRYLYVVGNNRLRLASLAGDSSELLEVSFDGQINNIIYNEKNDIFAVSDNWGNIRVLEGRTGSLLVENSRWDQYTYNAHLSPDGGHILFNNRWGLYTIDLDNLSREPVPAENFPLSGVFSPDSETLYFRKGQQISARSMSDNKTTPVFLAPETDEINRLGTSEDGSLLYYGTEKDELVLIHLQRRQPVFRLNRFNVKNWDGFVLRKITGSEGKYLLEGVGLKNHGKESGLTLISLEASEEMNSVTRSPEIRLLREGDGFEKTVFERDARIFDRSPDGRWFCFMKNLELYILDTRTGDTIFNRDNPVSGNIQSGFFTADSRRFIIGFDDGYVEVYDLEKRGSRYDYGRDGGGLQRLHRFLANTSGVSYLQQAGNRLLVKGNNAFISLFNADLQFSRQLDMDFIRDEDQVFVNSEGYYYSTKNALPYIAFKRDASIFPFEQLDLRFNRPDRVLESVGSTDKALVSSYKMAYRKRLKKFNLAESDNSGPLEVPEAQIVNRREIPIEQQEAVVRIHLRAVDEKYPLKTLNLWVNNVPVWGMKGLSVGGGKKNRIDTTISIRLGTGSNRIEVSVTNVKGAESFRNPVVVNYSPAQKPVEKIHFVGIGIDRFADEKYNLRYSTKDIRDLVKKLKQRYGEALVVDTLFNENVTRTRVLALRQRLGQTGVNDRVIISYSGHGLLSSDFDYYLSTFNMDFENPDRDGLAYDELENLLDGIPARKKLLLIDACHSGEVDKDDLVAMESVTDSLIRGFKPVAYKKEGQLGLKSSFELMQNLFVDVGSSTGAIIISAAAGTQFALEGIDNLPNGVFTYCILEALEKNPSIKISELKKTVGLRVEELTGGLQKPTSRNEKVVVDWSL